MPLSKSNTLPTGNAYSSNATRPAGRDELPIWPWLLMAGMAGLMAVLLMLGANTAREDNTPATTAPTAMTTESHLSAEQALPTLATPQATAPAVNNNETATVALTAGSSTVREVPNEQRAQPGDDSAYLHDETPENNSND